MIYCISVTVRTVPIASRERETFVAMLVAVEGLFLCVAISGFSENILQIADAIFSKCFHVLKSAPVIIDKVGFLEPFPVKVSFFHIVLKNSASQTYWQTVFSFCSRPALIGRERIFLPKSIP